MKLGISMWSYVHPWQQKKIDVAGFIKTAKDLGADGVELLDFFMPGPAEFEAAKRALAETGLPCGVFSVGNNLVNPDADERRKQTKVIIKGVDSAKELGAKVVRVFSGNPTEGITFEQALGWIIEGLQEGARYAEKSGVYLALENHGKLAGRSDQVLTIIEKVGSPNFGANPDTGNFQLVHQLSDEAVAALAKHAYMVHFKDFKAVPEGYEGPGYSSIEGKKFYGTAIGEGDVNLLQCVKHLAAAGFTGWLNIEYEGHEDPTTAMPRSVVNSRRFIAQATA